jgi:spermidine/putrescine transport system substrate-binding protein
MKIFCYILLTVFTLKSFTQNLNIYIWGNQIPREVFQQFEKKTGIHVNVATFDSNETMYAKIKATKGQGYDVIMPSSYFVQRLKQQDLLLPLDHNQIPNLQELDPFFLKQYYDPNAQYSLPLIWGATGIFYNSKHVKYHPTQWQDLWQSRFKGQLLLLDDAREVFSMALLSLGYSPNDENIDHIKAAYQHLLKLVPNIKLFANDGIQATIADEDAWLGMSWNGDVLKAMQDNPDLKFILPKEGYVIWIDCLAIPKASKNIINAHKLLNYLLSAAVSQQIGLSQGHALTNKIAQKEFNSNRMIYPGTKSLARAVTQGAVSEEALLTYNYYWQKLKLAF